MLVVAAWQVEIDEATTASSNQENAWRRGSTGPRALNQLCHPPGRSDPEQFGLRRGEFLVAEHTLVPWRRELLELIPDRRVAGRGQRCGGRCFLLGGGMVLGCALLLVVGLSLLLLRVAVGLPPGHPDRTPLSQSRPPQRYGPPFSAIP